MRTKRVTEPKAKSEEQALNSLMALCARAEKSSGDALRLMKKWGVDESSQQRVLEQLIKDRFIDDDRFTGAFIREKRDINGWGVYKIRMELHRKGIDRETIDRHITELDPSQIRDKLIELLTKRLRIVKYENKYQLRDKLLRYGASRGYDFSMLNECIKEVTSDIKEEDIWLD